MRSRARHRIVVAIAWAVIATAASFEGCFLGSFSDLQGGQVADASPNSLTTDVSSTVDATTTVDSGSGGSFCASQLDATFCDDFDNEPDAMPLSKWQPRNVTTGASLAIQPSGLSQPNSLVAAVNQDDSGPGSPAASVAYIVPGTVHFVRFQYDLFVAKYDRTAGSSAFLNPSDMRAGLTDVELRLYLDSDGFGLGAAVTASDGGSTYPEVGPKMTLTSGAWHHVEIDTDYSQTPAAVTFSFDYTVVVSDAGIPGATFGPGAITIEAPIEYARTPTSGWNIRVDNVAVFAQ